MKTYLLIALMTVAGLGHADPTDLKLEHVKTTAAGKFEMTVSFRLLKATFRVESLEDNQPVKLQDGIFTATVRSIKALKDHDNVIVVQLGATGFEGANGSRLTALFLLGMQQGNEYGILNANQQPILDSTANVERDLNFYLLGLAQKSLAGCSDVESLRVLVAYQRKFPSHLLKRAMNDAETGRFKKATGGDLCAVLPEAEADGDVAPPLPTQPAPKKTPTAATTAPKTGRPVVPKVEDGEADEAGEISAADLARKVARPQRPQRPQQRRVRDPWEQQQRGGYDQRNYDPRGYDQRGYDQRGYGESYDRGGGYGGYGGSGY